MAAYKRATVIILTEKELARIIHKTVNRNYEVSVEPGKIRINTGVDYLFTEEIEKALSQYFGERVVSVHADQEDETRVWVEIDERR